MILGANMLRSQDVTHSVFFLCIQLLDLSLQSQLSSLNSLDGATDDNMVGDGGGLRHSNVDFIFVHHGTDLSTALTNNEAMVLVRRRYLDSHRNKILLKNNILIFATNFMSEFLHDTNLIQSILRHYNYKYFRLLQDIPSNDHLF